LGGVSWTVGGVFAGFEALSAWQELLWKQPTHSSASDSFVAQRGHFVMNGLVTLNPQVGHLRSSCEAVTCPEAWTEQDDINK
jgi:hypothetical protein